MSRRLRILHLSDLHIGKEHTDDAWRLERVMGDAWARNLREIAADGPIDLICFTGDLAQSGKPGQYAQIRRTIDAIVRSAQVPLDRFFCVPGNHDIDRSLAPEAWGKLRELQWHHPQAFSAWMAGGKAPFGCEDVWRDSIVSRQQAYREFLTEVGLPHLLPGQAGNPHPRLGYRRTLDLGLGMPLHIIGFDSAWLAGDDADAGKLRLTEDQIGRLMTDHGRPLPGWSIGLIHHPLTDLADGRDAQRLLGHYGLGLLLHGHQHEPVIERWADPQTGLHVFAAGCLYEHQRYPNGLLVVDVDLPEAQPLRPRQGWARKWSHERSDWLDDELYRGTRNGRLRLVVEDPAPFVPMLGKFVGRDDELAQLRAALLLDGRSTEARSSTSICCVIDGMPGVGKTRLAEEFISNDWRELLGLPKGVLQKDFCARLALAPDDRRNADELAAAVLTSYERNATSDQLYIELRSLLLSGPGGRRMLLIENVDGPEQAKAVATLALHLCDCTVLATARFRDLTGERWSCVRVNPLSHKKAIEMLRNRIAVGRKPHPLSDEEADKLVKRLGYLPLALHIAGSHLGRGLSPRRFGEQLEAHRLALGTAPIGDVTRSDAAARSVISSAFAISWDLWCRIADKEKQAALIALAYGPAQGVGHALGAIIAALGQGDYEGCTFEADSLSLLDVEYLEVAGIWQRRVRLHPLIAEYLRYQPGPDENTVMARIGFWCDQQFKVNDPNFLRDAWFSLDTENAALLHWLERSKNSPSKHAIGFGTQYALTRGPYALWLSAYARWYEYSDDESLRGALCLADSRISRFTGDINRSEAAAYAALAEFTCVRAEMDIAITKGQIADLLGLRGNIDEALRIHREDELPVYERFGDLRVQGIVLSKIAGILLSRGQKSEALRVLKDEAMPFFEKSGDIRGYAITLGKISAIFAQLGEVEEALRIRCEVQLPIMESLGDQHQCAVIKSEIAKIMMKRGHYEDALRILRNDVLPVAARLGDMHTSAMSQKVIAGILKSQGEIDSALYLLQNEVLPKFESLGDLYSTVDVLMDIAELMEKRGDLEGALCMLRQDILSKVDGSSYDNKRAEVLIKISSILILRWESDEAIRILREEAIPICERLCRVQNLVVARTNLAAALYQRGHPEDGSEIFSLLSTALSDAERLGLPDAQNVREWIAIIFGPNGYATSGIDV